MRKLIAFIRRTFVTDCPVCHLHFFGFHNYAENVKIDGKMYRIVCHRCAHETDV